MKVTEEEEAAQVKWTLHPVYGLPSLMRKKETHFTSSTESLSSGRLLRCSGGELQTFFILKNK